MKEIWPDWYQDRIMRQRTWFAHVRIKICIFLAWRPGFPKLGKMTPQKEKMNGNGHVAYRWKGLAMCITKTLFVFRSVAPNSNERMTILTISDRHRVLALPDAGVRPAEVARAFNVNERTLRRHVEKQVTFKIVHDPEDRDAPLRGRIAGLSAPTSETGQGQQLKSLGISLEIVQSTLRPSETGWESQD